MLDNNNAMHPADLLQKRDYTRRSPLEFGIQGYAPNGRSAINQYRFQGNRGGVCQIFLAQNIPSIDRDRITARWIIIAKRGVKKAISRLIGRGYRDIIEILR